MPKASPGIWHDGPLRLVPLMPAGFDEIIVLDWSAAATPRQGKDSIWIGQAGKAPVNPATRDAAMALLHARIDSARAMGRRVLLGADFPFAYPAGFARALTGQSGALAIWDWLLTHVQDGPDNANNRFQLADRINAGLPGTGPFWGRPSGLALPHLPARGTQRHDMPFAEKRRVEARETGLQPVWKLFTTGSVGSQALLGIARLAAMRRRLGPRCVVWPFEPLEGADVVLAEVWPSLLAPQVKAVEKAYPCRDAAQVDLLARALRALRCDDWERLLSPAEDGLEEEGWILGAGMAAVLQQALARAMPAG